MLRILLLVWLFLVLKCNSQHESGKFEEYEERRNYNVSSRYGVDSSECIQQPQQHPCRSLHYLVITNLTINHSNIVLLDDISLTGSLELNFSYGLQISGGHDNLITITCQNDGGLFFNSAYDVQITNIHFVGCSMGIHNLTLSESINAEILASMTFFNGGNIQILNCSFSEFEGSAVLLLDVDGAVIRHSTFTGNSTAPFPEVEPDRRSGSGSIVIRRQMDHGVGESISYEIENCSFVANLHVPNGWCPGGTFVITENYTGYGSAIDIYLLTQNSTTDVNIYDSTFSRNKALYGGAVCLSFSGINSSNILNLVGSSFDSNIACTQGGALAVRTDSSLPHHEKNNVGIINIDSCQFKSNAAYWGGAVSMYRCRHCSDMSLSAVSSTWTNNNAHVSGFGLALGGNHTDSELDNQYMIKGYHMKASFLNCSFANNSNNGKHHRNINALGALQAAASDLIFTGNTRFESNSGTSLLLEILSRATFTESVTFKDNFGVNGGAIHIVHASRLRINSSCDLLFESNKAIVRGGAIYSKIIPETYGRPPVPCPFDFYDTEEVNVTFKWNTASNSDQSIFIGNPGQCNHSALMEDFQYVPDLPNQVQTVANTISFATVPEMKDGYLEAMLGEKFYLNPTVADKFGHNYSSSFGYIALLSDKYSATLNYTLVGPSSFAVDNFTQNTPFYIKGPEIDDGENDMAVIEFLFDRISTPRSDSTEISVKLVSCELGYRYSKENQVCECIEGDNIICPNDNHTMVCVKHGYWYDKVRKMAIPCPAKNCQFSNGKCPNTSQDCPNSPGYCGINHPDDVCWSGRGGYLCSQCSEGHAFNFAAFRCAPVSTCSSMGYIVLGVLAYWAFFILIMLLILTIKLSVGSGFMYGLVYYFSVITLFTDSTIREPVLRSIIYISISLTQMDPRIVTVFTPICFVKEMDKAVYHLMLLYITPVFVILTILAIIVLSRTRCCRLLKCISLVENSPIHAICLLILFAYTSLSLTNFEILRPMIIDGDMYVYASPDIGYFEARRHMPLALIAIFVELVISWPICLLFLFAPCLSGRVNLVRLRLKPIVDEFQACYRPECRWFAGFYFLARQLMYLANLIPQNDLPQLNTLLQCLSVFLLLVHTSFQPYKKKWLNILDTFFLIDISVLSTYCTVAAGPLQYSGLNLFIYNAAPYILILPPFFYLFAVVAVLLFKRIYAWLKRTRLYSSLATDSPKPTHSEVAMDYKADNSSLSSEDRFTDSFFKDEGEREPLLASPALCQGGDSHGKGSEISRSKSTISHTSVCLQSAYTELKNYNSMQ